MENTLENKAKLFAQYYGLKCCNYYDFLTRKRTCHVNGFSSHRIYESYLELKPLSSITDEDACHICMLLVRWQSSMVKLTKVNIRESIEGEHSDVKVVFEFYGSFKYTIKLINNDWLCWIDSNGRCEWTLFNISEVTDYLRSKGYALPYMGLSVETLVEYGWVKLT